MDFVLCTDQNYAVPCLVCIVSIFESNMGESCCVYVLTEHLDEATTDKFQQLADVYQQKIEIVHVDSAMLAHLQTRSRYRTSMYYRFLAPELLPQVSTALYLDCDIIVRHNLRSFFNLDISQSSCAVVEDQRSDEVAIHNRLQLSATYFNSGVLLMNFDYWRTHHVKERLIEFIEQSDGRLVFPDQDALNSVLQSEVVLAPYGYNFQEQWYWEPAERGISFSKWNAIEQYASDPAIVHFTWNIKPWQQQCWHPHKDWFVHYATLHPFIGYQEIPYVKPKFVSRLLGLVARIAISLLRASDSRYKTEEREALMNIFHIK